MFLIVKHIQINAHYFETDPYNIANKVLDAKKIMQLKIWCSTNFKWLLISLKQHFSVSVC